MAFPSRGSPPDLSTTVLLPPTDRRSRGTSDSEISARPRSLNMPFLWAKRMCNLTQAPTPPAHRPADTRPQPPVARRCQRALKKAGGSTTVASDPTAKTSGSQIIL